MPVGLKRIVCGDISMYSTFPEEKEVLFDLDSSFEIIEIQEDPEKMVVGSFDSRQVIAVLC